MRVWVCTHVSLCTWRGSLCWAAPCTPVGSVHAEPGPQWEGAALRIGLAKEHRAAAELGCEPMTVLEAFPPLSTEHLGPLGLGPFLHGAPPGRSFLPSRPGGRGFPEGWRRPGTCQGQGQDGQALASQGLWPRARLSFQLSAGPLGGVSRQNLSPRADLAPLGPSSQPLLCGRGCGSCLPSLCPPLWQQPSVLDPARRSWAGPPRGLAALGCLSLELRWQPRST